MLLVVQYLKFAYFTRPDLVTSVFENSSHYATNFRAGKFLVQLKDRWLKKSLGYLDFFSVIGWPMRKKLFFQGANLSAYTIMQNFSQIEHHLKDLIFK